MQWLNSAIHKKMIPSRKKLKAKGETSTLQTGKYNNAKDLSIIPIE